ncbi:hypothetical protein CA54_05970 [Symmachiella macrocystis]|uniref:DUF3352 domain-containing protein n=1 Tax=Symmachiella macrocystis TaxID=2527985 RepID=A0A5C6BKB0_9PLAN|nr:hypothetical protein [Symmachiella macrocystis]TWU11786.1 hypothetical protein CA54_05970 [Symmachiella macrocystis]
MLRRCAAIACSLVLVLTSAAAAVENPAELFSDDVSLIIRLKNPQATTKNVAEFADVIDPGFGQMVTASAQGLGPIISNPTLAGVDQEKDWWVGVFASDQGQPTLVFVIPAKDTQAMQEAVTATEGVTFLAHESWGIYSADTWTMDSVRACIDGKKKPLVASVDQALRETFERGDLSVFLHVSQLAKVFDADIAKAKDELAATADNAPPGAEAMLDIYLELSQPLFQSLEDATGAVVTLNVNQQGATLEALGKVKEGSETAKLLETAPSENALLTKLPNGGQAYYALSSIPKVMQEWSIRLMDVSAQLADGNDEELDKLKEVMRRMEKLKLGGTAGMFVVTAEGDQAGVRTASIMDVAKPQQMRLLTKELIAAQSGLTISGVETNYELTEDAETFGQYKADTLKVEQTFEQNPFFDLGRIMEVFFGEEGMFSRTVYTDTQVIQAMGGGKEAMAKILERMAQAEPPALGPELQITRDALSKKANLIGMIDLPGTLSRVARLILDSGVFPLPIDPDAISVTDSTSFFGISLATESQGARAKVYLPAEQAKQTYLFGMQVYEAFLDMQQQQF